MSQPPAETPTPCPAPRERDTWYYPPELADDLKDIPLPPKTNTNWERYLAFTRLAIISILCELDGKTVDLVATGSDNVLGYSISNLLATLFQGIPTETRKGLERDYRCGLLFAAEKTSHRRNGELFRRYANSLAQSPKQWFRMRASDSLMRLAIMTALVCNDALDVCFSKEQLDILCEITMTMYDSVAFYKHRSEGEVCNTFAYMPENMRVKAFRQCREVLWAFDAAWAHQPSLLLVINVVRIYGSSVHMLMRRYRFVEENLTIGTPETEEIVSQTRANVKLWYHIDASRMKDVSEESIQRYKDVLNRSEELLFPGLATILETADDRRCETCLYPNSYGTETPIHCFGGVQLCDKCKEEWRDFLESFPDRAAKAFPELVGIYNKGITSKRS
ncbi:Aba 3 protein [Mycena venus]|uniref:Aba 3 protein n=1 Tax=Mycena venus TaxID=2733690 RepID=A0A8H6XAF3_9AGAR|nr:Aba 3 protein [Mycena venus]